MRNNEAANDDPDQETTGPGFGPWTRNKLNQAVGSLSFNFRQVRVNAIMSFLLYDLFPQIYHRCPAEALDRKMSSSFSRPVMYRYRPSMFLPRVSSLLEMHCLFLTHSWASLTLHSTPLTLSQLTLLTQLQLLLNPQMPSSPMPGWSASCTLAIDS